MFELALFSGCAIVYIILVYPALLSVWAACFPKPVRRSPIFPFISVIIPIYNGESFVERKLRSVLALDYPPEKMEILVVSDGSTDRTAGMVERFTQQGVKLLCIPRAGKPAALNAAISQCSGEILVLTDIRQDIAPDSVRLMIESFADPSVGTVSGELVIRDPGGQSAHLEEAGIGLYWRFETWMRNQLSSIDSMLGATGPFYAIRRELAVHIPPDMLLDDMFLPLAAFFRGYRLIADPRARCYDIPTNLDTEFRRKVRTLAGNYQILGAYPALFGFSNRMWVHFMSYKFGRLLLPWLLAGFAVSSFWLPEPWRTLILGAQAICYFLALADPWIPEWFPLKRLSSLARTFVVMMAAAVRGLAVFFVEPRSLWKVTSASPDHPAV